MQHTHARQQNTKNVTFRNYLKAYDESHNRFQCHLLIITAFVSEWPRPAQVKPLGRSSPSHQPGSTWRRCHTFLFPVSQLHRKHIVTFLNGMEWCHWVRKLKSEITKYCFILNICGAQNFSQIVAYMFDLLFFWKSIALTYWLFILLRVSRIWSSKRFTTGYIF